MEKMKALRKKLAAKGGFTLVELIVVIAILAILAAVAVPTYTGYIKKAKEASDMQILSSVATAVVGSAAGDNTEVTSITVTKSGGISAVYDPNTYTMDTGEVATLLNITSTSTALGFQGEWTKAVMSDGQWKLDYTTTPSDGE